MLLEISLVSLRLIHSNFISRIVLNPIPHGLVLVMIAVMAEYVSGVKIGSTHNHFETFLSKTINYYFQNITFLLLGNFQARKYHSILINFDDHDRHSDPLLVSVPLSSEQMQFVCMAVQANCWKILVGYWRK